MNCNKIPLKDKGCHLIVGTFMGATLSIIMPVWLAFTISLLIAISKEMHDIDTTGFDIMDILATVAGVIAGISLYSML